MSHYPTSAELAAFRLAIEPNRPPCGPDNQWTGPGTDPENSVDNGFRWYSYPGGAWPHEREHGIGVTLRPTHPPLDDDPFRHQPTDMAGRSDYFGSIARREAARMRTAAYERIDQESWGDAGLNDDFEAAQWVFVPFGSESDIPATR